MSDPIWALIWGPLCHLFVAFDMRDTADLTFSRAHDIIYLTFDYP